MAQPRASKRRYNPPNWIETLPTWVWLLVIASWSILLYGSVLHAPFVYDDLDQIVRNPNLASWHSVFTRFLTAPVAFASEFRSTGGSSGASYRPLFWLSLALDRQLWELRPVGFHLTNLLLHLFNGVLLFSLLRRLRLATFAATAAALLWLSLPINSEAVAWISARAYLLCLFFLLLSLLATVRYLEGLGPINLVGAFTAAVAALLSHESGVLILPFAALVIALSSRDNFQSLKTRPALTLLAADLAAFGVFFALRVAVGVHGADGPAAFTAFAITLWRYLGWVFLPIHMSVERSTSTPPNTLSVAAALAWAALLALIALTAYLWRRIPPAAFGLTWLLLALAPFCGLVFLYQGMAERFAYIASIGVAIAIVSLCSVRSRLRPFVLGAVVLWAIWGIYRLETRLSDWSSPVKLYRDSLEATPNSSALLFNLGFTLREAGNLSEAVTAYQNAIRLSPRYQRAYASLGETYTRMGRLEEAREAFQQALSLNPADAGTTLNLAVVLHQSGHNDEAEREFRHAIALAPNNSDAYTDLGVLLYEQGHANEAARMFQSAIDRNATDPTPYFNLAILYQESGHPDRALALYRKVLELRPNDPDTVANIQRLENPH